MAGLRGRSPGRRSSSSRYYTAASPLVTAEPPRDLRELREQSPGVRWGNNVPPREAPEQPEAGADYGGLPEAYLLATRGAASGVHAPPQPRKYGRTRSSSSRRPVSVRGAMTPLLTPRSPWKGSGTAPNAPNLNHSGLSGIFSAPRSAASQVHARPSRPSKSPSATSRIYAPPPATHPRRAFTPAASPAAKLVPGFGAFLTTAAPPAAKGKKGRGGAAAAAAAGRDAAERSTYSKAGRRRTPSPRPGVDKKMRKRVEEEKQLTSRKTTDKLMRAYAGRVSLERELKQSHVDPTAQIAPDLDDYLRAVHRPAQYGSVVDASLQAEAARERLVRLDESNLEEAEEEMDIVPEELAEAGWTPLHWAARQGQLETVQMLLKRGADVRATLPDGQMAIDVASQAMEEAALAGEGIEEWMELTALLDAETKKQLSAREDLANEQEENLGAGVYRQILRKLPRQAWDTLVDMLREPELKKAGLCCKGLQLLVRPRLLRMGKRLGASSESEDMAIALYHLQTFGKQKIEDITETEEELPEGVLYLLQAVAVMFGGQWVELEDTLPVVRYLLRLENPLSQLSERARDPERITWEQATWVRSIFAERADEMGAACSELLGSLLTAVICVMAIHAKTQPQLPPMRLPEGYLPPSQRPAEDQLAVTTLKTL